MNLLVIHFGKSLFKETVLFTWIRGEESYANKTYLDEHDMKTVCHLKKDKFIKKNIYTVVAKIIRTLVFSPAKNGFKSIISIFCCSVSEGNISLHFQTLILPLIVIIQWDFLLKESENSQCSTHRSDLIINSLSGMTWRNTTNWDRLNPEELWDTSRNLPVHVSWLYTLNIYI